MGLLIPGAFLPFFINLGPGRSVLSSCSMAD